MKTKGYRISLLAMLVVLVFGSQLLAKPPKKKGHKPKRQGQQLQYQHRHGQGPGVVIGRGRRPGMPGRGRPGFTRGPRNGGMQGIARVVHQLNLTPEQRKKVRTIVMSSKKKTAAAHQAVMKSQMNLHRLVIAGAEKNTVHKAAAAVGKAIGNEAVVQAGMVKSVTQVLTASQRKKLKEIMARAKPVPGKHKPKVKGRPVHKNAAKKVKRALVHKKADQKSGRKFKGMARLFQKDANKDGRLTKKELIGNNKKAQPRIENLFKRADKNKDGVLTRKELENMRRSPKKRAGKGNPRRHGNKKKTQKK